MVDAEENIEDFTEIGGPEAGDKAENKEAQEKDINEAENGPRQARGRGITYRIFHLFWKKKWVGISVVFPLGAFIAIGITVDSKYWEKEKPLSANGSPVPLDSFKEERLSPFFIPLTNEKGRRMVRLDLSVVWSALASVKYKKNELPIRDQMFSQLRRFTWDNRDLNNDPGLLESNLQKVLQNALEIYNLEVKVREINYF